LFFGRLDAAPFDDADCLAARLVVWLFCCLPRCFCWLSRCSLDAWQFDQFDVVLLLMLFLTLLLPLMPLDPILSRSLMIVLVAWMLPPLMMLIALLCITSSVAPWPKRTGLHWQHW
jgi:hypothetical protein